MVIREVNGTITVSGGSGFATINILQGELKQLVLQPTTETTQYDVSLTNNSSFVVYETDDIRGTHNELISIPMRSAFTLTLDNVSADEDIDYYISFVESHA